MCTFFGSDSLLVAEIGFPAFADIHSCFACVIFAADV